MNEQANAGELKAWCNGYEVVAATTEDEARAIVRDLGYCDPDDPEDADGDGWEVLDASKIVHEEYRPTNETVGDIVRRVGKPAHLWSCEQ